MTSTAPTAGSPHAGPTTTGSASGRTSADIGTRIRSGLTSLVRGRADAAAWERPSLIGLLLGTLVLYVWNLDANGWGNSFYAAAVQAGSEDWTAFFYGSSDAANSITVDKPPASLWVMALSVRLFGLSTWSILLPEVIMGVVTVALVYATVRRHFSAQTALIAGAALALTPVAALMFRFDNPDALLVLLLTLATMFTLRGVETGAVRWVLWAGVMIGLGFLTKQLQAFLLLPVLAGVYLWAAPVSFRARLMHSLGALGAVILSAGWWVAIVELVPESWRPYIGGSQDNSFLELTFGYNGLGRLTGEETGSVGGGNGWGDTGFARLFTGDIGGQIAWLLPAALVLMVAGFVILARSPRTDARRATLALFAGWLLITAVAFSFMAGIFHSYYTVALAPAVAVVAAVGASLVWERRRLLWARMTLAVVLAVTAVWAFALLSLATDWLPWLKFVVLVLGLAAAALMMLPPRGRAVAGATVTLSVIAALLAPAAYSLETVSTAHTGSIVSAGPTVAGSTGGRGGGAGGGQGGGQGGGVPNDGAQGGGGQTDGAAGPGAVDPSAGGPGAVDPSAGGRGAGGPGADGTSTGTDPGTTNAPSAGGRSPGATGTGDGGTAGGMGSLLGATDVSAAITELLLEDADSYTWVAAAIGSNSAAGFQLATLEPVMAVGGFNGSDPSPTLSEFQALVNAGEIHYFVGGSVGRSDSGSSASTEITAWVASTFTATTIDGVTLYDLTE